jgi:hypothetical protein
MKFATLLRVSDVFYFIYLLCPQKRKLAESLDTVEPASITAQSPAALQSYLSAKQARTFSTMSALELEDMQIPGKFMFPSHVICILKTFR